MHKYNIWSDRWSRHPNYVNNALWDKCLEEAKAEFVRNGEIKVIQNWPRDWGQGWNLMTIVERANSLYSYYVG